MANVNQAFCGLHYLIGLAGQAETCLKVWERILFNDQKVRSPCHGGYSNGKSAMTRLIQIVCKSVQERGCEKSGQMVSFASYVKDEFDIILSTLFPFLGNRFTILFLNGAGVYLLYDMLLDFYRKIELNKKKLLEAVHWDLNVFAYRVGWRALGLIEKLITGPLWKIMNCENYILGLSKITRILKTFKNTTSFL